MKTKDEKFPIITRRGSSTVKIYREMKPTGGTYYRVSFYKGGKRCGISFTELDKARLEYADTQTPENPSHANTRDGAMTRGSEDDPTAGSPHCGPWPRRNSRRAIGSASDDLYKPIGDNKLDEFIVLNKFSDVQLSTGHQLKSYLETLSGVSPHLRPLEVASLPLFLRNRFSFYSVELFGRSWCLAQEDESWDTGSPGEYEKQAETLRPLLKAPVVFVLATLPSNARNRMVQKGIPFIVPGTQAFLPGALVDLRERFPKPSGKGRTSLSPTAQLALLYHLEREPLSSLPLRSIAEKLHCSAMMLSKVKDELEEAGICEVERNGRSMVLKFPAEKRELWNLAQNRLTSPVKKTRWVRWTREPGYPALLSGISALSRRTMLADDRLPTYAFGPKMLESYLEQGVLIGCRDADQATTKMEVWSYEPKLLGDNEAVDPLSLYLSLRYNADERVQQQLERLMEEVQW